MVARDVSGKVIHVQAFKSLSNILEVAELEAIGKALRVAKDQGWSKVIMEFDAQIVVHALNRNDRLSLH